MKIKIVKNRYLNALLILMLFSAILHTVLLLFLILKTRDLYVINYFNILDIDSFYPNIFNSFLGNALSIVFTVVIYLVILKKNKLD